LDKVLGKVAEDRERRRVEVGGKVEVDVERGRRKGLWLV